MMAEAAALDPTNETFREYEGVVDPKYLSVRKPNSFSTKLLSRGAWSCRVRNTKL
jgi:hypothetical protein